MTRVFDCFPFCSEIDVLRIHLKELSEAVDVFILIEGSRTHTGHPKPFCFQENRHLFREYEKKLIARAVELSAAPCEPGWNWGRENAQRSAINGILAELGAADDDIVISGDVDEIARPRVIDAYRERTDICAIEMPTFHYNLNCRLETPTIDPKICRYRDVKREGVANLRYRQQGLPVHVIRDGGWHLSFMGGTDRIIEKLKAYAHYDDRDPRMPIYVSRENVEASVKARKSVYMRDDIKYAAVTDLSDMPRYILENWQYFVDQGWILDGATA